ncbi:uncharacterized protein LOC128952305 [Oppia nitens]|uniref:uncharacterized protein LOC128952305 n=1 Tax=Oppia nitens TaxID=1686743 RepID=UPI0023DB7379|nr:uncharacterized protein LOC128952305 [Oppia nitens]
MRTTYDDINCLQFSKLSINSPKNLRKEYGSDTQTSVANGAHHRSSSVLPRIEFPTHKFEKYLNMGDGYQDIKSKKFNK